MSFANVYDDAQRAAAYAGLDFPGTYYLAFRDLPRILAEHMPGGRALDFGCGAGRSTRFLTALGFATTGIDISAHMVAQARAADPHGDYRVVPDGVYDDLDAGFDLILSAFAFDNIPDAAQRARLLRGLRGLLAERGRIVLLGSRAEIYHHEWVSFTTRDFPENAERASGQTVRIVMKDVPDRRPVVDVLWRHRDYQELFAAAGLRLVAEYQPLGSADDPVSWLTETRVAPWFISVLAPA